jgi:hypothetical protein
MANVLSVMEMDAYAHAHCRRASVQRSGGRFQIVLVMRALSARQRGDPLPYESKSPAMAGQ